MEASSLSELFERHGAAVFRRCRQLLGEDHLASDAVQDVFLKALAERRRFRGDASPLTWLYGIATTHCLQQLRNTRRRVSKLAMVSRTEPTGALADERLNVLGLLEDFPLDTQRMAVMRHIDGMNLEEIAAALGVSTKTVSRKLAAFVEQSRFSLGLEVAT